MGGGGGSGRGWGSGGRERTTGGGKTRKYTKIYGP